MTQTSLLHRNLDNRSVSTLGGWARPHQLTNWHITPLCHSGVYGLVRFNTPRSIWTSKSVAHICLHWKSVEVCTMPTHCLTHCACCSSHWLHSSGMWDPPWWQHPFDLSFTSYLIPLLKNLRHMASHQPLLSLRTVVESYSIVSGRFY